MALAGVRVSVAELRMSTIGITTMLRPRVARRNKSGSNHPSATSKCASRKAITELVTTLAANSRDLRGMEGVSADSMGGESHARAYRIRPWRS
jgi:hypothetical protein